MWNTRVYLVATLCIQNTFIRYVSAKNNNAQSIYDFTAKDIHGNDVSLERYKGHVCIIVNVASECGLTNSNYEQLNNLDQRYGEKQGLKILAFPSNDFGGQEPGSNEDILKFAQSKGAKFDLFAKISVNGENAHPLWKYLKEKQGGFLSMDSIKWNFTKFLIDKNGQVVSRYAPTSSPNSMVEELEKLFTENLQAGAKNPNEEF